MKKEILVAPKQGYVFNKKSGKLESFKHRETLFTRADDNEQVTHCDLGGKYTELEGYFDVYADIDAFKKDDSLSWVTLYNYHFSRIFPCWNDSKCWFSDNGRAIEVDICDELVRYEDGVLSLPSGKTFYSSKEEVYKYNDIIVKEVDGSERVVESLATKLKFSTEQLNVIAMAKETLAKCTEQGITLLYSQGDNELIACNTLGKELRISYDEEKDWVDIVGIGERIAELPYYTEDEWVQIKI